MSPGAARVGEQPEGDGGDRGDGRREPGDHSRFWELRSVWTFWNIGLASLLKLYSTEIIHGKYYFLYFHFHIGQEHLNLDFKKII